MNLLINAPFMTVAEAAELGVRRISVGGTLARTAWAGFLRAAQEIADAGTFSRVRPTPRTSTRCSTSHRGRDAGTNLLLIGPSGVGQAPRTGNRTRRTGQRPLAPGARISP